MTAPDSDGAPAERPARSQAEASALLEAAARERGLGVHRLDEEIVICAHGRRRVLFYGLMSSSSSKLAQALCGDDAWLRFCLARQSLPVTPTRLVGLDDARFAQRVAEQLGYPVRLRLAGGSDGSPDHAAADRESFRGAWRALLQAAPDPRARVVIELVTTGNLIDVPVVAGRVVAGDPSPAAASLAIEAVGSVPGLRHGSVRIIAAAEAMVHRVDGTLRTWVSDTPAGRRVTAAILDHEFRTS